METLVACPQCQEEVQVHKVSPIMIRFKCQNHGDLGTMPFEEFQQAFQRAQASVEKQEGLGKAVRATQHFISADPKDQN
jgi:hypothetical protein